MSEELQESLNQTPVINLSGICKSFGSRVVLETISFSVTGGEGFCICGANAAGKTTLLKIITGLLQPDDGMVELCESNMTTEGGKNKLLVGTLLHKSMVYPQLTVIENLRFFAALYGVKDNNSRIQELLELTGLMPYRYDNAGILSRGMTQRLAIARAMVHKPIILLADEPFAGLDEQACKHLIDLLSDFKDNGGTVVMTTHNINYALNCCEKIAVLDDRKLIFNARVPDINTAEFAKDYLSYARQNSNALLPDIAPTSNASPERKAEGSYLKNFANVVKAIFIKDIVSEFRTKQALPAMVVLGVVIVWIFRIAAEAQAADKSVPAAAVLLVAILFSAILASERSFAIEKQNNCISALILAPVDAGDIYISKLLVNITMLCAFELVAVPTVFALFNVSVSGNWLQLIVALLLINIGISSVGTLLGCAVQGTKTKSSLLSILMAAVLCPLMIPAVFALLLLFKPIGDLAFGGMLTMVGNFKTTLGLLTAFDAIFITVCWLLFGFVVREQEE